MRSSSRRHRPKLSSLPFTHAVLSSRRPRDTRLLLTGLVAGIALTTLLFAVLYFAFGSGASAPSSALPAWSRREGKPEKRVTLFIAIGSAPRNGELRRAARFSYLQDVEPDSVAFKFFTDEDQAADRGPIAEGVRKEMGVHNDVVQMRGVQGGYGTSGGNAFGVRGLWQMRWALDAYDFRYYLRIDDDSYLCLRRLLFELERFGGERLFWGRYWCKAGRNRADESFMLWSRDVIEWIVENTMNNELVPWDNNVTLGWNWGYWSWLLNLEIIDDQRGIDSQQGYLTKFAHSGYQEKDGRTEVSATVADFCEKFLYAHHVKPNIILELHRRTKPRVIYSKRPLRKGRACPDSAQSFLPGRHSKKLPQISIQKDDPS